MPFIRVCVCGRTAIAESVKNRESRSADSECPAPRFEFIYSNHVWSKILVYTWLSGSVFTVYIGTVGTRIYSEYTVGSTVRIIVHIRFSNL